MGDLINSEIFQQLKFGAVDTSNKIFKLFANLSPAIFFLFSAIVIATSYIGDPIKCFDDKDLTAAICWIHGTYHIPTKNNLNSEINNQACKRSYDGPEYEDMEDEEKDKDTAYYQWVPFMLAIHGIIFLLPANMWNFFENGLLEQFGTRKDIATLIEEEEIRKLAEQNARRFTALSRRRNNRYFIKYVLCEVGNILALLVNFCIMDKFLGGRFKYYGSKVISHSLNNNNVPNAENPMCAAFPTLTNCVIKFAGATGKVDERSELCVLSQNIINQKLYIAIWFWMVILIAACGLNTIYRIAIIFVPAFRKQELVWLINTKRRKDEFLDKDNIVREQWEEFGKIGNWFVLCQIGRNSNSYYFREFLKKIIDNDRSRNNDLEEGLSTTNKKALLGAD